MSKNLVNDNINTVMGILFRNYKLNYNKGILKRMREHPDYPSFLSVQHILKQEGLNSLALKVTLEELQDKLPKPVLVHVYTNTDLFLLVKRVKNGYVHILNKNGGDKHESVDNFVKMWDGNAMIFDSKNLIPRKVTFKENILLLFDNLRIPFLIAVFISIFIFYLIRDFENRSIYNYLFVILPLIGVLFSTLLIIESFDVHNALLRKICSSKKIKTINCSSILSSKDAYFIGVFSWSDIGLVYFSFILLLNLIKPEFSLAFTGFLSFLSFPYVFYSIYYQRFKAKSWCLLCLGVQALLLVLFVVSVELYFSYGFNFIWEVESWVWIILIFLLITATYSILKPLISRSYELSNCAPKYRLLKHNNAIKEVIFENQFKVSKADYSLVLGKPNGSICITLVISPICNPCMNELDVLLPILKRKEDTRIEVLFLTDKKENNPHAFFLSKMLIDKYQDNENSFFDLLEDYVDNYPASKFRHKIQNKLTPIDKNEDILLKHINWCVSNKIYSTPKIFIDYKQLPDIYSVSEIDYMCT